MQRSDTRPPLTPRPEPAPPADAPPPHGPSRQHSHKTPDALEAQRKVHLSHIKAEAAAFVRLSAAAWAYETCMFKDGKNSKPLRRKLYLPCRAAESQSTFCIVSLRQDGRDTDTAQLKVVRRSKRAVAADFFEDSIPSSQDEPALDLEQSTHASCSTSLALPSPSSATSRTPAHPVMSPSAVDEQTLRSMSRAQNVAAKNRAALAEVRAQAEARSDALEAAWDRAMAPLATFVRGDLASVVVAAAEPVVTTAASQLREPEPPVDKPVAPLSSLEAASSAVPEPLPLMDLPPAAPSTATAPATCDHCGWPTPSPSPSPFPSPVAIRTISTRTIGTSTRSLPPPPFSSLLSPPSSPAAALGSPASWPPLDHPVSTFAFLSRGGFRRSVVAPSSRFGLSFSTPSPDPVLLASSPSRVVTPARAADEPSRGAEGRAPEIRSTMLDADLVGSASARPSRKGGEEAEAEPTACA